VLLNHDRAGEVRAYFRCPQAMSEARHSFWACGIYILRATSHRNRQRSFVIAAHRRRGASRSRARR